jgi:hypothetical protein
VARMYYRDVAGEKCGHVLKFGALPTGAARSGVKICTANV